MFQQTLLRMCHDSFARPVILTHESFRFLVSDQAHAVGHAEADVIIEPKARDTAAAVLAAALRMEDETDTLVLITPVEHFSGDRDDFQSAILAGADAAQDGSVVMFGDVAGSSMEASQPVRRTGAVLMRRSSLLDAMERYAPDLLESCGDAVAQGRTELEQFLLDPTAYATASKLSFEDDILDGVEDIRIVPLGGSATTQKDWNQVWQSHARDTHGVALSGNAVAVACTDTLLRCEDDDMKMVGIGLENIVAVAMRDAILVADRDKLDLLPNALGAVEREGALQATDYPRYHRPWGWYETLIMGERFQVKRIMVKPGGILSLQSHVHRSEHWVVVGGAAMITLGTEERLLTENEYVYIPVGTVHRMANPGKVPMYLIEVQTGPYLGEDDIVRYEDIYNRS